MMNQTHIGQDQPLRGRSLLLLLLLTLLLALLAWAIRHEQPRQWQAAEPVALELDGQRYRLPRQTVARLPEQARQHFNNGAMASRNLFARELDLRLDAVFAGVEQRLPDFADWYYSLRGEYSRTGLRLLSWLGMNDADALARQAAARLFPEGVWDGEMRRLESELAGLLQGHEREVRQGWLAALMQQLAPYQVAPPLSPASPSSPQVILQLDYLQQLLQTQQYPDLEDRLQVSSVLAGGAGAGAALWSRSIRGSAAVAGRSLAARGTVRAAARAGGAGAAALCAPAGPVALACATVAGAATWISADLALLKVNEALYRDELLQALEANLRVLREDIEAQLLETYDSRLATRYSRLQEEISKTFIPAHRLGASVPLQTSPNRSAAQRSALSAPAATVSGAASGGVP